MSGPTYHGSDNSPPPNPTRIIKSSQLSTPINTRGVPLLFGNSLLNAKYGLATPLLCGKKEML